MRGISAGIDIGTGAVTTIAMSRSKSGPPLALGIGRAKTEGVRRGTVIDPEALARAIKKSATEAAKMADVSIAEAAVAFGGASIRSSLARGVAAIARADGEITAEDVRRSLRAAEALHPKNANREIIHLSPREFWVDGEGDIKNPVGMVGMRLETEALIIDGEKRALQNLVNAFDAAGIGIWDWIFSPLASSRVILTKEQRELGVMLLDIGAGTSDYGIWREGVLVGAGAIPIGGELATHDIAVMFKTKVEVAEAVKLKYGHVAPEAFSKGGIIKLAEFVEDDTETYSQKELGEAIRARMADIFELAADALRRGGRPLLLPAGIVLIGGGADVPGFREFAKKEMRLPAERGQIWGIELGKLEKLVSDRDSERRGRALSDQSAGFAPAASFAPAIGAALWHLEESGGFSSSGIRRPIGKVWPVVKNWLKIFLP